MFSLTSTGINFIPLWTPKVTPTISGIIIDDLAQVFITSLLPDSFIFKGSTISQQQQIGNAVPPKMAKFIAQSVKSMIYNAIKKAS